MTIPRPARPAERATLGLELVVTLADQLGAEFRVERGAGTGFWLDFAPSA